MSIEALAMAGIHYLECSNNNEVSVEEKIDETLPPRQPRPLVKEESESKKNKKKKKNFGECTAIEESEMKESLLAWAKAVAATVNAFTRNETR